MPRPKPKRIILGVTGTFGSGKSTVAKMFAAFGAQVINADKIAHACMATGKPCYKEIVGVFGRGILKKNRSIDRGKLGRVIFNDFAKRSTLNEIVHPEIVSVIKRKLTVFRGGLVVLDAPLLLEARQRHIVDKLLVVTATRKKLIRRIAQKSRLRRTEIEKRLNSQIPMYKKVQVADFIIDNSRSLAETKKQVKKIWRLLWKN